MTDGSAILLVVAAAFIDPIRGVLMQQRPAGKSLAGLWEFPGGKVDPGESPAAALARELDEELGVAVDATDLFPIAFATHPVDDRQLVLLLYGVRRWIGTPRAIEADALCWAEPDALRALPMPPADTPLLDALARYIG